MYVHDGMMEEQFSTEIKKNTYYHDSQAQTIPLNFVSLK